ncbi:MAG TPA: hypothetical protein VN860_03155 [Candidatus Acidoferrales bacterium]|nr:hypothetical protein [Candidatus Acidoferrales bacterium]
MPSFYESYRLWFSSERDQHLQCRERLATHYGRARQPQITAGDRIKHPLR